MNIKTTTLTDKIRHLEFSSQTELALTFLRAQECFENPEFKGKQFTLEEFMVWYVANSPEGQKTGNFTYLTDWDAFNLPPEALVHFRKIFARDQSNLERELMQISAEQPDNYVIATYKNGSEHDVRHELAHGLFYTNSEYKNSVLQALSSMDINQKTILETYLASRAGYHPDTFLDEMQAYLIAGHDDLRKAGIQLDQYADVVSRLQTIFNRFVEASPKLERFEIKEKK